MLFAADPVLVAVALGLLSELALDDTEPEVAGVPLDAALRTAPESAPVTAPRP
jgi:hypothetical protein